MKNSLVLLSLILSLWACNSNDPKEVKTNQPEKAHQHETKTTELNLNNGAKWNSDESTNQNVSELKAVADRFKTKNDPGIPDYKTLAGELQSGLDKMIKECRMQGADHDALHLWLSPLLKDVSVLKAENNKAEASELFSEIDKQLNKYQQYFE